jgi:indole-3-glycerol phosphate synthase
MQNHTITGVAAIAVDITRQVQIEQALQQSEDRHRIVAEYKRMAWNAGSAPQARCST